MTIPVATSASAARILTNTMQPIVCDGEWEKSDVCDEFRLRLDTLDFPDFWLSCRFDAAMGRVVVDGGRFSTSWNAEMGH